MTVSPTYKDRTESPHSRRTILFVASEGFPEVQGGVNTLVRLLHKELRGEFDTLVGAPADWKAWRCELRVAEGITHFTLPLPMPPRSRLHLKALAVFMARLPVALHSLWRLMRDSRVDLVSLQTLNPSWSLFSLLRLVGGPRYVVSLRGSDVHTFQHKRWIDKALMRFVLFGAAGITSNSKALLDSAARVLPGLLVNARVIHNGLNTNAIRAAAYDVGSALTDCAAWRPYMICIGSLDEVKGQDLLVRAWGKSLAPSCGWKLVLVGEGPWYNEVLGAVRQANACDSVVLVGSLANAQALSLLRHAAALVLPSRHEGFGNVLVEAAALSKPVLAFAVGGVPEIVNHGENGLLVKPGSLDEMARGIEELAESAGLRRELGNNGKRIAETRFRSDVMAKAFADFVNELLSK